MNLEILIPGKLSASPVQHPATPALITAEKDRISVYQHTKHKKSSVTLIFTRHTYHHLFPAASSKSKQPNCVRLTKLQMSIKGKYIRDLRDLFIQRGKTTS